MACSRQSLIWSALKRHVLVDLGDILVGQLGELREGDDALLGQLLGGDRADALDHGQIVRLALRRLEQRRGDGGLCLGFCLRGSLSLGFLLGLGFLRRGLGLRLGRYLSLGFLGFHLGGGLLRRLGAIQQDLGDPHGGQKLAVADACGANSAGGAS